MCIDSAVISMKPVDFVHTGMTGNIASENDDLWIEDEIQHELDQLDDTCLLSDDNDELYSLESHLSTVDVQVVDYLYAMCCEVS